MPGAVRCARLFGVCAPLVLMLVLKASLAVAQTPSPPAPRCGALCLLDGNNRPLDASQDSLAISTFITNGPTLPTDAAYTGTSLAASDVRVQVTDPKAPKGAFATLESRTRSGALRASLRVPLTRPTAALPLRSAYVRLVADEIDQHARGAESRTLRVALRDYVVVRYQNAALTLSQHLRVGEPGDRDAPGSARRASVHIHVLRVSPDGPPVIGRDDADALALMRLQLLAANEIWLQCNLSFGEPSETAMEIVSPPPASMLAVANEDGLPARGAGELRFRVNGRAIGPIPTLAGARPVDTANSIARELERHGFFPQVTENLGTRSGAGRSADVLVRTQSGALVSITPAGPLPLSSDARQSLRIGKVDLGDGIQEFDNMTAQVGSLEERTMIKALADEDPRTIDIFVVNQFTAATRQGEAFIAEPHGPIVNMVLIDRNGLRHAPLAWTLAHELGHVLMNDPLHPDNVGPDRPWLLMDADNGRGTVDGPKRLRSQDCQRMRETARRARFPLLAPFDRASDAPPVGLMTFTPAVAGPAPQAPRLPTSGTFTPAVAGPAPQVPRLPTSGTASSERNP
mgnify:CR=1 FL=1